MLILLAFAPAGEAQRMSYALGSDAAGAGAYLAARSRIADGEAHRIVRRQDLWLVPGSVGRDSGLFLLDTGAPGLILHREARRDGHADRLAGATGALSATHLAIDKLQVANLEQRDVPAIGIDLSAARALLGEDLIGIIGYGQLRAAEARLDFRQRTIRFRESEGLRRHSIDPSPAFPAAKHARVYAFDFQAHLPTVRIGVGDGAYALAFDTGSEVNVFDAALLPQLNESLRGRPSYKDVSGVDAHVERAPYALVRLALLEDDHYSNRPFAFLDLGGLRQNLPALDGILGVDFWGADGLVIDYANRQITTLHRQKKAGRPIK